MARNVILTWDNLQKREWIGPGLCTRCHKADKNIQHIFINCAYTTSIWAKLEREETRGKGSGEVIEIADIWENCTNENRGTLITALLWNIWLERNNRIISSKSTSHVCIL